MTTACHPITEVDPVLFDADRLPGESGTARAIRHSKARTICAECPISEATACLDGVLADPEREGIYAGYLIENERPTS